MPLYEYECKQCANRFELIQKFSDDPVRECPKCRGEVVRLISPPAVQFKGTGWYVTDYAKKNSAPPAKSNGSSTSDSGEKTSTTSPSSSSADKPAPSPSTSKKK